MPQHFTTRVLRDDELAAALETEGLRFDRVLTTDERWVAAVATG